MSLPCRQYQKPVNQKKRTLTIIELVQAKTIAAERRALLGGRGGSVGLRFVPLSCSSKSGDAAPARGPSVAVLPRSAGVMDGEINEPMVGRVSARCPVAEELEEGMNGLNSAAVG
jgi:hypothetical protein